LETGYVIGNPIPKQAEGNEEMLDHTMKNIMIEVEDTPIANKNFTSFVLERAHQMSEGKISNTLQLALLSNGKLASTIAKSLCEIGANDNGYWNTDLFKGINEMHMVNNIGKFSN